MRPEDVPVEIVEAACRVTWEQYREATPGMPPWDLANAVGSDYPETRRAVEMLRLSTRSYVAELWPLIARRVLAPLLAVHERYFNTEVDAYDAAEDFAPEDAWRFDRDFREAARLTTTTEGTTT